MSSGTDHGFFNSYIMVSDYQTAICPIPRLSAYGRTNLSCKKKRQLKRKISTAFRSSKYDENFNISGTPYPLDVKQFLHNVSSLLIT